MSERGAGLRLRLVLGLFGAALLALALFAVVLLLMVRDGLYARRMADAHERLAAAAVALVAPCPAAVARAECIESHAEMLSWAGLQILPRGACAELVFRERERVFLCEEVEAAGRALSLSVELGPVREQLAVLDARLFLALVGALLGLVLLSAWIVERGVVRRLAPIDEALAHVGQAPGGAGPAAEEPQLLTEGGDALGRLGAAVNRLAERLRQERGRTQEKIVSLQGANVQLADEQRALREAREDLARSERLATVGRLAAGVAHEVGNPLTAIIGYADLLRGRLGEGDGSAELAARIGREAARMDRILRDLLDLARPRDLSVVPLALAQVVAEAHALVAPQKAWAGCALELQLREDLPRALGDEHYAVQVLVNLLLNSARAGARHVRVSAVVEGGFVQLEVEDDGGGIAPEHFPRLFEPFFTSASPGEGTGLGLALCHASMERVGGSISAVARPAGRGALFRLRFRCAAPRVGR